MDSNQEPDFEENEFIYDDLDLDDVGASSDCLGKYYFHLDVKFLNANFWVQLWCTVCALSIFLCVTVSINMSDEDGLLNISGTPTSTNSSSPSPSPGLTNHSKDKPEEERKRHKSQSEEKGPNQRTNSTSSNGTCSKVPQTPTKQIPRYQALPSNN